MVNGRHQVTHIICSNFPNSKIKNLRLIQLGSGYLYRSGVPYQLDQLANNQLKLSDFFAMRSSQISEDASVPAIGQAISELDDSSLNDGILESADLSELDESVRHERRFAGETQVRLEDDNGETMIEQPSSGSGKSCEVNMAEPGSSYTENESNVEDEFHSRPIPTLGFSYSFDNKNLESRSSTAVGNSKKPHSTCGDPNVVENYFKMMF